MYILTLYYTIQPKQHSMYILTLHYIIQCKGALKVRRLTQLFRDSSFSGSDKFYSVCVENQVHPREKKKRVNKERE